MRTPAVKLERQASNFVWLMGLAIVALAMVGCDGAARPSDEGAAFLRLAPRSAAVSIAEAVSSQSEQDDADESSTHSIEGVIYAGDLEPFQPGVATFVLSELPDSSHGDGSIDHLSECAFCRDRSAKKTKALVEFRDETGKLIKTTASDLLGVAKGDRVIVTGRCSFDDVANMLTVKATSLEKIPVDNG